MTTLPSEIARKQSAEVVSAQPLPRTVDSYVVRPMPKDSNTARVVMWIVLLFLAAGFAGLMLSMLQQAS
jgi:hypothetical protein